MAKGQDLSRHQQGIVRRYYEHRDGIAVQRLAQIVSDLYVTDSPKASANLWGRAAKALASAGVEEARVKTLCDQRDVQKLAAVVGRLSGNKP